MNDIYFYNLFLCMPNDYKRKFKKNICNLLKYYIYTTFTIFYEENLIFLKRYKKRTNIFVLTFYDNI